jgi:hypothetical protein
MDSNATDETNRGTTEITDETAETLFSLLLGIDIDYCVGFWKLNMVLGGCIYGMIENLWQLPFIENVSHAPTKYTHQLHL